MSETPITPKIKERARKLWEDAGSPAGREVDYIERARELAGLESNPKAGLEAVTRDGDEPIEEAKLAG